MSPDADDEPDLGGDQRAKKCWWSMTDRLSPAELQAMVESYRNGATAQELAATFSISMSSVKRVVRRAGARKRRPPG